MSTTDDLLDKPAAPDRVFYELGVMLDKDDFRAEQTYHRGRLARALAFLHGTGTAAGLRVTVKLPAGATPPALDLEEVHVGAGLAVDAAGRLIEMSSERCLRLQRWLLAQGAASSDSAADAASLARLDRLRQSFHPTAPGGDTGAMVVDLMLRFAACERGKTPAFATGPFDALDAVQPSRIRDGFELQLVPRIEDPLPVPVSPWPDLAAAPVADRPGLLRTAIFAAWDASLPKDPPTDAMVPAWLDPTGERHWLFLARLRIPATRPAAATDIPARVAASPVQVDNDLRPFVFSAAALARLGGL